ncbi:hypothetical protein [Fuscovulum blasticum]|uniref:hypothetical protein n=1 Tax=Fuscovulum blasticum TaxID=1075 RepID=UPI000D3E925C|nr:hypothetical protein [Fuscovulum blasticum]AWD22802.1 hypothetical protein B6K69_14875 [Fuscovulum blasticum]
MTALKKYQRLESTGLWRAGPGGQRQEVIVRLGEATLMLTDPRSEQVLSHWSLPAVTRQNPGVRPALFVPGEDADETLEIDDDDMIAALKTVQAAVRQATPRPGRLRAALIGGTTLAIVLIVTLVLPGVLKRHTASALPAAKRAEIGQLALDDVIRLTGKPCDGSLGLPALARLSERVFGPEDTPILYILPEGLRHPAHLPGGVILLPRDLIDQDTPEALAGAALAEGVASRAADPLAPILDHVGLKATFGLLTSGQLPDDALQSYGEDVLRDNASAAVPDAVLIEAAKTAQVPLSAYARWRDPSGTTTAGLLEGDPYRGLMPTPILPDDDWIALQSVCSD